MRFLGRVSRLRLAGVRKCAVLCCPAAAAARDFCSFFRLLVLVGLFVPPALIYGYLVCATKVNGSWLPTINTRLLHPPLSNDFVYLVPRKVQEGGEEVRAKVCTDAMDFMEGMRDGWNGLIPPVAPNLVSFNIIIKVGRRSLLEFVVLSEATHVVFQGRVKHRFALLCTWCYVSVNLC